MKVKSKKVDIPEINSYYLNNELFCERCDGKMMTGVQYYAIKKNWIDIACNKCSRGADVEVRQLNQILIEFNFKTIKERYVTTRQDM